MDEGQELHNQIDFGAPTDSNADCSAVMFVVKRIFTL